MNSPKEELPQINFGRLTGYIGYQVRLAQSAIFRDLSRAIRGLRVTPGEFSLLTVLEANPGVNSVTLVRVYKLDKTTLSLSLKRLTKRGLIETARSDDDRRYYSLHLTTGGRQLLRKVTRKIEKQERAMDAVLRPGGRAQLLRLLARISSVFER
ncbi:MAG: hypothetical protein A2W21_03490 [Betaproteobacteria bacterium RBG_16_66_20]|nr:MAG: hypothetical protein A2W21_03490 [Betaproteobacteria bacterium RBG_16_66_20]